MRYRVVVRELDPLHDLAGVGIVLEEGVLVRVRAPQIILCPADPMRTVAGGGETLLDDPALGVDAVDHS